MKTKLIEKWCQSNGIDYEDTSYLGKGHYGEAHSLGNGRVLKVTNSGIEYDLAKQLQNKHFDSFAAVYSTEIFDGEMVIVLEELDIESNIEDLFYELMNVLDAYDLPLTELRYLDLDEGEVSVELEEFIFQLENILSDYFKLGVFAPDISPYNMGYSSNGVLKAFDIDERN